MDISDFRRKALEIEQIEYDKLIELLADIRVNDRNGIARVRAAYALERVEDVRSRACPYDVAIETAVQAMNGNSEDYFIEIHAARTA